MNRTELLARIASSKMFSQWHWFRWHFNFAIHGYKHPFSEAIVEACLACDAKAPGYAVATFDRLAAVGGREKHLPDWEQLLQILAELHVANRVLNWAWPDGARFQIEPHAQGTRKNPEMVVELSDMRIGIEVKAPAIFKHIERRATNPIQIASRFAAKGQIEKLTQGEAAVTMPRDNVIKDFLESAEGKFAPFCATDPQFFGILVIVWDDFVYEAISALVQAKEGLFTDNSFHKDEAQSAVKFPSVAGVVVVRHLHQLLEAARHGNQIDGCEHAMDFGKEGSFPWKAFIQNPWGRKVPEIALAALDARELSDDMGAEYRPQEYIMWFGTEPESKV